MKKSKYRIQKDLTLTTASFFILVFAWVSFNIYHTHVTSTLTDAQQVRIQPIKGKFDTATINKLKTRTPVEPDYASPFGTESGEINLLVEEPTPTEPLTEETENLQEPTPTEESIPLPIEPTQEITP